MKNLKPILKPTLIQYSNQKHREGIRQYFQGQYRFDYGPYVNAQHNNMNRNIHVLNHNRSKSESLDYLIKTQQKQQSKQKKIDKQRYKTERSADKIIRNQQYRSPHKNIKTFDITTQSIQLPRISKITANNPQISQKPKLLKPIKKRLFYICANDKCPTKANPIQQVSNKPLDLIKNARSLTKKKAKLIKIAPQPQIRKRYTPTFVCSRDNPLPCFKIFETI